MSLRLGALEAIKLENEYRRTMAQILSTVFLVGTLYFTWRQLFLTDEGKITDRFSNAVGLLASKESTARIGGIYALERISNDSPRDYKSVLEVLSTFVRQSASRDPNVTRTVDPTANIFDPLTYRAADVQAALTVLSRRAKDSLSEHTRIFLNNCDLRNCVLVDGKLQNFIFDHSDLSKAILLRARLQGAFLKGVDLRDADLSDANFEEATLEKADLSGADLSGAVFDGCDLREATLENVKGIDQIASAFVANIAGIKASEEVKKALSKKQAVSEPSPDRWRSIKKQKILFRSLYSHEADD